MSELFDDVDDKIRRNLVVFSFFVMAAWWLGLPIEWPLDNRDAFKNINRDNLLWLTLAVQIYLLLRYRFSRAAIRSVNEYKLEAEILFRKSLETYIANKVTNFYQNLDSSLFSPRLRQYVEHEEKDDARGELECHELVAISVNSVNFEAKWSGTVSCTRNLVTNSGNEITRSGGFHPVFFVGKLIQTLIWLKVLTHVALYTRGSIELLLPVVLGIASSLTILYELIGLETIKALLLFAAGYGEDICNAARLLQRTWRL